MDFTIHLKSEIDCARGAEFLGKLPNVLVVRHEVLLFDQLITALTMRWNGATELLSNSIDSTIWI